MTRNTITTGSRVGSAQFNPNDEKQSQSQITFDPATLVSKVFDVWDAPVVVRGFQLDPGVSVYLQMSAGCFEGDVFEDVVLNGYAVRLWAGQKMIVCPVDGRYRLRLDGALPDDVRVVQYRTNAWTDLTSLMNPVTPGAVHIPLYDTFDERLGDIDPIGGDVPPLVIHIPLFDSFAVRLGDIDPIGGDYVA